MALFGRKGGETDGGGVPATALVVHADAPALGGRWGGNPSTIRVLVDAGSGPVLAARSLKLDGDQWLVAGMEVPVKIDASDPDSFEIDWDAVPAIEERAAANDPTLADPIGTDRKVAEALKAAGLPEIAGSGIDPARFEEALDKAAQAPAVAGKTRAVVLIATIRGRLDIERRRVSPVEGKCPAVLAVNVPGKPAYAVFDGKFEVPKGHWDAAGGGLPALVSSTDPNEVEVLWEEMPSLEAQIGDRIATSFQDAQAQAGEMERQMMDAIQQATTAPPGVPGGGLGAPGLGAPGLGAPGLGAIPGMQDAMARNAKLVLQSVKDPAQRKMLIEQYRAAGIPIEEDVEAS